jgi:hypothetical protein
VSTRRRTPTPYFLRLGDKIRSDVVEPRQSRSGLILDPFLRPQERAAQLIEQLLRRTLGRLHQCNSTNQRRFGRLE